MRIKRFLGFVAAVLVGVVFWPWIGNPFAYANISDALKTSIPVALVFGEPCATYDNGKAFDPGPDCFKFDAPRDYTGIWIDEFEGSTFLEGVRELPNKRPPYNEQAWLSYSNDTTGLEKLAAASAAVSKLEFCSEYVVPVYRLTFRGIERTGETGHMGLRPREIIAQQISKVELLHPLDCKLKPAIATPL